MKANYIYISIIILFIISTVNCGYIAPTEEITPPYQPGYDYLLSRINTFRKETGALTELVQNNILGMMAYKHAQYLINNVNLNANYLIYPNYEIESSSYPWYSGVTVGNRAEEANLDYGTDWLYELNFVHQFETTSSTTDAIASASIQNNTYQEIVFREIQDSIIKRARVLQPNLYQIGYSGGIITNLSGSVQYRFDVITLLARANSSTYQATHEPQYVTYPKPLQSDVPCFFLSSSSLTSTNTFSEVPNINSTDSHLGYPISIHFQVPLISPSSISVEGLISNLSAELQTLSGEDVPFYLYYPGNTISTAMLYSDVCLVPKEPLMNSTTYGVKISLMFFSRHWMEIPKWYFTTN